ncbi:MAG: transcription elongation factor GreA [Patescibacteria group bacterium]
MSEEKATLVTREGLRKLQEELDYLKSVKRKEVAKRIKEAISYGDLSENSEYEDAKNDQAFIEGRVIDLEDKIKYAKIIDDKQKKGKTVQIGSTVIIERVDSKSGEHEEYTIVGSTEADPINNKISNESPVGKALLGKSSGERIKVDVPKGDIEYKIVKLV